MPTLPVTIQMIRAAAARLAPHAVRTPLLEHPALNASVGGRVFLKCENLQRVGAFKFRGAYNKISQVDPKSVPGWRRRLLVGQSRPGRRGSCDAVRPQVGRSSCRPTRRMKIARTKAFGGEVIAYDREREDRDAIARALCVERKAAYRASVRRCRRHRRPGHHRSRDHGGGGAPRRHARRGAGQLSPAAVSTSGIAVAVKDASPSTEMLTVEPAGFDDFARSLASGKPERNERLSGSICDALMAESPGELTLAIGKR